MPLNSYYEWLAARFLRNFSEQRADIPHNTEPKSRACHKMVEGSFRAEPHSGCHHGYIG